MSQCLLKYLYLKNVALHFGDFQRNSLRSVSLDWYNSFAQMSDMYIKMIMILKSGFTPQITKIATFSCKK